MSRLDGKAPKKTVKVTSSLCSKKLFHHGHFASLYIAEYSRNNEKYDVLAKKVRYLGEMEEDAAKEFCDAREARWKILYGLRHGNVLQYFDGFFKHMLVPEDTPPQAILVMEHATGGDLGSLLEKGDLPRTLVLDYLRQLLLGLEYLALKRIVHAHLTPSNLYLSDSDSFGIHRTIKIGGLDDSVMLDFHPNHPLETRVLEKAARFLAPEVAVHCRRDPAIDSGPLPPVTTKSDTWSLGVVLLDMDCYSGKTTFIRLKSGTFQKRRFHADEDASAASVMRFVAEGGVPEIPVDCRKSFHGIWDRCFVVDPRRRASPTELLGHSAFTVSRAGEYLI